LTQAWGFLVIVCSRDLIAPGMLFFFADKSSKALVSRKIFQLNLQQPVLWLLKKKETIRR